MSKIPVLKKLCPLSNCNNGFVLINYKGAINPYFVYNINISLKSVFKIHGANLPHYHCQLTPLVGHVSKYEKLKKPEKKLKKLYQLAPPSPSPWLYTMHMRLIFM
ncbi:hypothetical protein OUZ56_011990 [Daphnia magna]|uniref:Uncharacterized protein n=1 Tax=Daphnia magna TaxID=35525 RepID=A0ABQ9Z1P4_9CRUS|nr:hypothetical protein OUZ56_011987 [Daphnia magna]KAK4006832.1 hypothetical protein OUZ56_011990 [Daphnia magna]